MLICNLKNFDMSQLPDWALERTAAGEDPYRVIREWERATRDPFEKR